MSHEISFRTFSGVVLRMETTDLLKEYLLPIKDNAEGRDPAHDYDLEKSIM